MKLRKFQAVEGGGGAPLLDLPLSVIYVFHIFPCKWGSFSLLDILRQLHLLTWDQSTDLSLTCNSLSTKTTIICHSLMITRKLVMFLEVISPFYGATDNAVVDFWWHLLWVLKPDWAGLFVLIQHLLTTWEPNCSLPHTCEQAMVGLETGICHGADERSTDCARVGCLIL